MNKSNFKECHISGNLTVIDISQKFCCFQVANNVCIGLTQKTNVGSLREGTRISISGHRYKDEQSEFICVSEIQVLEQ